MTLDPAVVTAIQGTTRAWVYGASAIIVGAAVFDTVVVRRAAGLRAEERASARAQARTIGLFAADLLLLGYLARFYLQIIDSFLVVVPTAEMVSQLFLSTRAWGLGILAQLIISASVTVLLMAARRARADRPWLIVGTAFLAAVSIPLTGHAIGHAGPVAVAAQATHVFAVGAWLGTLTVLWLVGRRMPSADGLVSVIRAFSPVALTSAALLATAGTATYFLHVGALNHLLSTRYGVVLIVKIVVFLSAAGVGYVNWRHLTPRLARTGRRETFTRAAALEITLAVVALLLTTVLTNLPQPGDD